MRLCAYLIIICVLGSCKNSSPKSSKIFELQNNCGIQFENKIENNQDFNILVYRNFYNGGGVATGDLNNDGLPEVLFTANMSKNKLFLNKGDFQFEDITEKSKLLQTNKWATAVIFVDINADGWLDIYICYAGYQKGINNKNELYINNHDLTFTERAHEYNLDEEGFATHIAFFDYDLDGDLDAYLLNNSFIPVNTLNYSNQRNLRAKDWPVKDFLKGGGDKLLRNENGKFIDVSEKANIFGSLIGFGLGVTVGDVDGDRYPDLYISNDFFERDYLYINQKNGTFKESLEQWMQHISHSSMGADIADINNDGYPDIFTTDMLPNDDYKLKTTTLFDNYDLYAYKQQQGFYNQFMQNTLQLNNQNGKFSEIAHYSGVAASDWSWGGLIFDANNDGLNDLFVCNGIYHDVTNLDFMEFFANNIIRNMVMTGNKANVQDVINKMPSLPVTNKMYINKGNLKFADLAPEIGLDQKTFSNGAAYADLDNDGDLDLLVNNVNQASMVYKNLTSENTKNNFLRIQLIDSSAHSQNKFCIGAFVKIFSQNEIISRELIPSRGFQSSVEYVLHIGIGNKKIDSVHIEWQDASISKYDTIALNQKTIFYKPAKADKIKIIEKTSKPLFEIQATPFFKHQENNYVDFYKERGVPMMLSKQGPQCAIADLNHDGLEDVYISGAANQIGHLYLQSKNGFIEKKIPLAEKYAELEETALAFFDANQDGHIDLWISHGGNEKNYTNALPHRLYVNDGNANFSLSPTDIPLSDVNVSVVLPLDFDKDGDLDVFIAGRNVTQEYGTDANSYLLLNKGKANYSLFLEEGKNPFEKIGMITGAIYEDILQTNQQELVLVGEWMSPLFYQFKNNHWQKNTYTTIHNLKGWWQSIACADLNHDGLKELILGNLGENFYLHASPEEPVKIWVNDFDKNGITDKILTRTILQKDMPVFSKKEITEQLPLLKKENLNYSQFANKSIQELFPHSALEKSTMKEVTTNSSIILWNKGKGVFETQALPQAAQFSSVNAILPFDINADNQEDLLLAGNNFSLLPQFSSLDASFGNVFINQGNTQFVPLSSKITGWIEPRQVRAIKALQYLSQPSILLLLNNEYPQLYILKNTPLKIKK